MWSERADAFVSAALDWAAAESVIGMSNGKRAVCGSRGYSEFHGKVVECGCSIYSRIGNIWKCNACGTEYEVTSKGGPADADASHAGSDHV